MARGRGKQSHDNYGDTYQLPRTTGQKVKKLLKQNMLLLLMVIAMVIGILIGYFARQFYQNNPELLTKRIITYWYFPGKMILNLLKVCIIPLVIATLISGMASLPKQAQGRLGGFTVIYYLITTFMAVLLGILLVSTIKPGDRNGTLIDRSNTKVGNAVDTFLDIVRNIFPGNIIAATMKSAQTDVKFKTFPNGTSTGEYAAEVPVIMKDRTNMLGLITFSIAFGVIVSRMGKKGKPLKDFFDSLSEAMMNLIRVIIWLVPLMIVFLVAGRLIESKNLKDEFSGLGFYILTVLLGLGIHGFIVLPIILLLLAQRNPLVLLIDMSRALLTALGTASSSATMPVTLRCLTEKAKVNKLVAGLVIPVGATINMDGTALYEAVASIYLAQSLGMHLTAADVVVVSITATLAAIGAAGVPEAGLFTMLIVLQAIGVPFDKVGLIVAVDWFLDRCRTTINVWGDSIGAVVVEKLTIKQLERLQLNEEEDDDVGSRDTPPPSYGKRQSPHMQFAAIDSTYL